MRIRSVTFALMAVAAGACSSGLDAQVRGKAMGRIVEHRIVRG